MSITFCNHTDLVFSVVDQKYYLDGREAEVVEHEIEIKRVIYTSKKVKTTILRVVDKPRNKNE